MPNQIVITAKHEISTVLAQFQSILKKNPTILEKFEKINASERVVDLLIALHDISSMLNEDNELSALKAACERIYNDLSEAVEQGYHLLGEKSQSAIANHQPNDFIQQLQNLKKSIPKSSTLKPLLERLNKTLETQAISFVEIIQDLQQILLQWSYPNTPECNSIKATIVKLYSSLEPAKFISAENMSDEATIAHIKSELQKLQKAHPHLGKPIQYIVGNIINNPLSLPHIATLLHRAVNETQGNSALQQAFQTIYLCISPLQLVHAQTVKAQQLNNEYYAETVQKLEQKNKELHQLSEQLKALSIEKELLQKQKAEAEQKNQASSPFMTNIQELMQSIQQMQQQEKALLQSKLEQAESKLKAQEEQITTFKKLEQECAQLNQQMASNNQLIASKNLSIESLQQQLKEEKKQAKKAKKFEDLLVKMQVDVSELNKKFDDSASIVSHISEPNKKDNASALFKMDGETYAAQWLTAEAINLFKNIKKYMSGNQNNIKAQQEAQFVMALLLEKHDISNLKGLVDSIVKDHKLETGLSTILSTFSKTASDKKLLLGEVSLKPLIDRYKAFYKFYEKNFFPEQSAELYKNYFSNKVKKQDVAFPALELSQSAQQAPKK